MGPPSPPDARLSNYRLDRLLGAGGMGSVYLAHDLALDRPVAIKFIAADRAGDESSRRRLIREARAAAALEHPNICGVHEVIVEPDGRACIVMQYVEGQTLAERLRAGPVETRLALAIAADMASALAAAHRRGIVHRDLKPGNIILTADHHAKLLDFGLALHTTPAPGKEADSTITGLTAIGAIVGTPGYMSPEQIQGLPLDGRSDLFSLGCVLYECLTGQRAFSGGSRFETAQQVLYHHPPAPSTIRKEVTEQHDELCGRLLAKHPQDRFRSADELLGALRVLSPTGHSGIHGLGTDGPSKRLRPPPRPRPRVRLVALAAAAVLAIAALVGLWRWNTPAYERTVTPEAKRLYTRGVEWIRDGAYHSGRRALEDAIASSPQYVPAFVRLAEACTELDDYGCAQDALNNVNVLVTNEASLPEEDRIRVRGVRALMLRNLDVAVAEYQKLTVSQPRDPGAWVDLGRAQETAANPSAARASYEEAIRLQPDNAVAHLRRAITLSQSGDKAETLEAFLLAEDQYRRANNADGQTEAILRKGSYLNGVGDVAAAREALEKAASLASTLEHQERSIRVQLQLSSLTASEGNFSRAQQIAEGAVAAAVRDGLDAVAAEGLIDLVNALMQSRPKDPRDDATRQEMDAHLERAILLAERRNAPRIVARARLVRASLLSQFGQPEESVKVAREVLQFMRKNHYRRYELQALLILARGLQDIGDHEQARQVSEDVLRAAQQLDDDASAAIALDNLAVSETVAGNLPRAEDLRSRSESLNRRMKADSLLPFDLANRAELLIRLGRAAEAETLLIEIQRGMDAGIDSYKARARRVLVLRALMAATTGDARATREAAGQLLKLPEGASDGIGQLGRALAEYADAHLGANRPARHQPLTLPATQEPQYWTLYGAMIRGEHQATLTAIQKMLAKAPGGREVEWRLAALGAICASGLQMRDAADTFATRASAALDALRVEWKDAAAPYEQRADLAVLISRAGLRRQS